MSTQATRITPTVGRVVWFMPGPADKIWRNGDQPLAAIVAAVLSDRCVNLAVFDANGSSCAYTSVPLVQEGDPRPRGYFCEWMPYQKGQAAKTTAALQQSSSRITAGAEKPSQVVDSGAAAQTRTGDLLITNQGAETAETLGNQQDTPSTAPVEGAQAAQGESSTCEGVTAGHGTRIEVSDLSHDSPSEAAKWERLHDELYAEIASEHRRDEYGETETAAECVRRVVRERDQLRAQLDEYERAPTIGVIRDVGSWPYCDWKVSQATLPKSGAEIIARPARKGE